MSSEDTAHLKPFAHIFLAFKWMNCLLLREFRLSCVMRLWDTYLSEGDGGFEDFHVYVCASFLVHFSSELQQMGFDELFQFMQVSLPLLGDFISFLLRFRATHHLTSNSYVYTEHAHRRLGR